MEKAVREADIQITGNLFHKSVRILACADDVDIVARCKYKNTLLLKTQQIKWD
jgi:hypothetical protein